MRGGMPPLAALGLRVSDVKLPPRVAPPSQVGPWSRHCLYTDCCARPLRLDSTYAPCPRSCQCACHQWPSSKWHLVCSIDVLRSPPSHLFVRMHSLSVIRARGRLRTEHLSQTLRRSRPLSTRRTSMRRHSGLLHSPSGNFLSQLTSTLRQVAVLLCRVCLGFLAG